MTVFSIATLFEMIATCWVRYRQSGNSNYSHTASLTSERGNLSGVEKCLPSRREAQSFYEVFKKSNAELSEYLRVDSIFNEDFSYYPSSSQYHLSLKEKKMLLDSFFLRALETFPAFRLLAMHFLRCALLLQPQNPFRRRVRCIRFSMISSKPGTLWFNDDSDQMPESRMVPLKDTIFAWYIWPRAHTMSSLGMLQYNSISLIHVGPFSERYCAIRPCVMPNAAPATTTFMTKRVWV